MKIVAEFPPNYAEVKARFDPPVGTVFAWGDTIYAPGRGDDPVLEAHLVAHEEAHGRQQAASGGPAAWWLRYLEEPRFRLEQEVEAYRAQLAFVDDLPRPERREMLAYAAKALASRMYGGLVTKEQARRLLTA